MTNTKMSNELALFLRSLMIEGESAKQKKSRIGDVVSPRCGMPLCYPNGETPSCKLGGGTPSVKEHVNSYCPVDDSAPKASQFLRHECRTHGTYDQYGNFIRPCKEADLPAECLRTVQNLRLPSQIPETQHSGLPDICFAFTCGTLPERFTPRMVMKKAKKLKGESHSTGVYPILPEATHTTKSVEPQLQLERVLQYLLQSRGHDAAALALVGNALWSLKEPPAVVRDTRDGIQRKFEANTKQIKVLRTADEKPKPDRYEYSNGDPSLTLSNLAGENAWYSCCEKLSEMEVRKEYHNHFDYYAKAQAAAKVKGEVSAKRMQGNTQLDPLRSVSNVLADWSADTKRKVKENKLYLNLWPTEPKALIEEIRNKEYIKSQHEEAITVVLPTSRSWKQRLCKSSILRQVYREIYAERDLNLQGVPMANRMGTRYNVKEGVWQPFREGWQPVGVPAHPRQRSRLEHLFTTFADSRTVTFAEHDRKCVCMLCRDDKGYCIENYPNPASEFSDSKALDKHMQAKHSKEVAEFEAWHNKPYMDTANRRGWVEFRDTEGTRSVQGLLEVKHKTHGSVLFVRTLATDRNRAVITQLHKIESAKKKSYHSWIVNVDALRFNGKPFVPPVMKEFTPELEPFRAEGSAVRERNEMLHNFLCVVYPDLNHDNAMELFRKERRTCGDGLPLSETVYSFVDLAERRKANKKPLHSIIKNKTENGYRWLLNVRSRNLVRPLVLVLGVIGSADREDKPTPSEALRHCIKKARKEQRIFDGGKTTEKYQWEYTHSKKKRDASLLEWAGWLIKAHLCREKGGKWGKNENRCDDIQSIQSASPASPTTSFDARLKWQGAQGHSGVQLEEVAGDEVAETTCGLVGEEIELPEELAIPEEEPEYEQEEELEDKQEEEDGE